MLLAPYLCENNPKISLRLKMTTITELNQSLFFSQCVLSAKFARFNFDASISNIAPCQDRVSECGIKDTRTSQEHENTRHSLERLRPENAWLAPFSHHVEQHIHTFVYLCVCISIQVTRQFFHNSTRADMKDVPSSSSLISFA